MIRKTITTDEHCADCGQRDRRYGGRGMCSTCYRRHLDHGTHTQFARSPSTIERVDLRGFVEDLELLGLNKATNQQIADRLGIACRTVERRKACARAEGLMT